MKKKFFALMMAMVMVLSLAACSSSDEADPNSGDSAGGESSGSSAFKVGVIGPLTGGAAIYGTCVANSAQIAVDEINALGGDIQFELMTEDDVNDAETSVNAPDGRRHADPGGHRHHPAGPFRGPAVL